MKCGPSSSSVATRIGKDIGFVPSVLDRLVDDQPTAPRDVPDNRLQNIRDLERAVARDLEALLNTRQETLEELPSEYHELDQSLLVYGLPDFTIMTMLNQQDRNRIRRAVEQAIANFEPRLERVRVMLETAEDRERGVRFRIDALLKVEPASEPVTFDAVLQLNTQEYQVRGQT